ncbi:MAG: hypothetical protein RLZZ609_572 [Cyanobacteriota bacterium]|jgi:hypothetical protein
MDDANLIEALNWRYAVKVFAADRTFQPRPGRPWKRS